MASPVPVARRHRVVIIGSGFGGLNAAKAHTSTPGWRWGWWKSSCSNRCTTCTALPSRWNSPRSWTGPEAPGENR